MSDSIRLQFSSISRTMVIPVQGSNIFADWGDGLGFQLFFGSYPQGNYPRGGTKQVDIRGAITNIGTNTPWDADTLLQVVAWDGTFNLNGAFRGASNLISVPNTCPGKSLTYAFYDCPRIDLVTIASWNMSLVTDVSYMFGPVPQMLEQLQEWRLAPSVVYTNFITDSLGNDISKSLSTSPFYTGPVPSSPLFSSLGSFALQPNPPVHSNQFLYTTNSTSLFAMNSIILYDFASYGIEPIGPCIEIEPSVLGSIVFDNSGQYSLFKYTLGSGAVSLSNFISMPSTSIVRDALGNLIFADYIGNLYTTDALSVFQIPPGLTSDLTVVNNNLYATFGSVLVSVNLATKVVTSLSSQFPGVTGLTSHLGRLYYYSSGSLKSYDLSTQTIAQVWDFNTRQGTGPIGPLSVDPLAQVLYGICEADGPGIGSGLRAAGTLWSYTLPAGPFIVLTPYVTGDTVRGSVPITYSISSGTAYVITGGGSAMSPYTMGQIMLPGYGSCFNHGTNILCQMDGAEVWRPIETLRQGDLVKTYKHGIRSITQIGKGALINNPDLWHSCMYQGQVQGFEPLIVTGGHSLLVDTLTQEEREAQAAFWGRDEEIIDDKLLMIAPVSKSFNPILTRDLFTYYHFTVENDGDDDRRYGVWANGFLTETPSVNQYKLHKYMNC